MRQKGFTLIELLVVIAIIGILSSVVLASLNSAREKSRDARRVSDVKQIQLALELYFDSSSTYPVGTNQLVTEGFIAAVPTDPVGGGAYPYEQLTGGTDYHLGANLEDSGHSALDGDVDTDGTVVDGPDADGCSDEATRYCYDVTP